jgi:hypothetical protein
MKNLPRILSFGLAFAICSDFSLHGTKVRFSKAP